MKTIYLAYRNLSEKDLALGNVKPNGFEQLPAPGEGALVVKAGVFPGMFGVSDLHITKFALLANHGEYELIIIAYTNTELSKEQMTQIKRDAVRYLTDAGAIK